jgi:eukaryotic-like serine/threonine-protein kinase
MLDDVARRVRALGEQVRRPQNRSRLVVGSGLVVVLVLAVVGAMTGIFGGSSGSPALPSATGATPSASGAPLIPIQEFKYDRGIVVNVPKGWVKSVANSYVDFTDPTTDGVRKVRINVDNYSGTALKYLQQAENWLKKPSNCRPAPYERVRLREAQLDGWPGAELEYTCGEGDQMRHGIWRAIVVEANAYHFYLTVPDAQFAASKVIFEEMVRSFRLTAT